MSEPEPRGQAGYTLVEVITASVAAGVLVLVALSAFLAAQRAVVGWERDRALEADALAVASALARDAARAEGATADPGRELRFEGRRPAVYAVRESTLVRNGTPMLDEGVRLEAFEVEEADGEGPLVVRFVLGAEGRTAERRVVHAWRAPARWPDPPDR